MWAICLAYMVIIHMTTGLFIFQEFISHSKSTYIHPLPSCELKISVSWEPIEWGVLCSMVPLLQPHLGCRTHPVWSSCPSPGRQCVSFINNFHSSAPRPPGFPNLTSLNLDKFSVVLIFISSLETIFFLLKVRHSEVLFKTSLQLQSSYLPVKIIQALATQINTNLPHLKILIPLLWLCNSHIIKVQQFLWGKNVQMN